MDYRKYLLEFGQSVGIFLALMIFLVIFALIMMALGPQSPPSAKMTCDIVNATTFCHF